MPSLSFVCTHIPFGFWDSNGLFVGRSVGIYFSLLLFSSGGIIYYFFCCSCWLFLGFPGRRLFPRVFPGWKREWQQRYVLAFRNKKRTRRKMILFFGNTRPIGEGRGGGGISFESRLPRLCESIYGKMFCWWGAVDTSRNRSHKDLLWVHHDVSGRAGLVWVPCLEKRWLFFFHIEPYGLDSKHIGIHLWTLERSNEADEQSQWRRSKDFPWRKWLLWSWNWWGIISFEMLTVFIHLDCVVAPWIEHWTNLQWKEKKIRVENSVVIILR